MLRLGIAGISLWGCPIQGVPATPAPANAQSSIAQSEVIDIIVPVYGGRQETLQCIQSVLSAKSNIAYRIVVVDDCSPDLQLGRELRRLASDKKITLLLRPINAGFSGAVNTGASLDDSRDLVLLNADTQVFDYWLDRLRAAAYQSEDIGTVTPLSNFGELVSYPQAMENNPVGDIRHAEQLDALLRTTASERVIDLPAGVGFCMYIKRVAWHRVGGLDEFLFGRGYGEDTDLCLRVRQAGWRNVCAANTYVVHWGSKSFGAEKAHLVAQNLPKLYAKYPEHEAEYDDFLNIDPLGPLRRHVQRAWLAKMAVGSDAVLELSPTDDGNGPGRPRFVLNAVEQLPGHWRLDLECNGITGLAAITYEWPAQGEQLQQDLLAAGFVRLHIARWADWPARVLDFLTNGFLPYRLQLDDFSAYCPRRYRLQEQATACGDPSDISVCQACVQKLGPLAYGYQGMEAWLSRAERLLGNAEKINALNDEIYKAHRKRFPGLARRIDKPARFAAKVQNSQKSGARASDKAMRVAVFGGQTSSSGYYRLQQQVKSAWERQLDVQWLVFGNSLNDSDLQRWPNVRLVDVRDTDEIFSKLDVYQVQAIAAFSDDERDRKWACDVAYRLNIPLLQETQFTH